MLFFTLIWLSLDYFHFQKIWSYMLYSKICQTFLVLKVYSPRYQSVRFIAVVLLTKLAQTKAKILGVLFLHIVIIGMSLFFIPCYLGLFCQSRKHYQSMSKEENRYWKCFEIVKIFKISICFIQWWIWKPNSVVRQKDHYSSRQKKRNIIWFNPPHNKNTLSINTLQRRTTFTKCSIEQH